MSFLIESSPDSEYVGLTNSVEIFLPVLNEEMVLPRSVAILCEFLAGNGCGCDWQIVIVDNGSTDNTLEVAKCLAQEYSNVRFMRLERRGRGLALRKAWLESTANILAYMDVDLSTDLSALPELVKAIKYEGCDIAIGSRLKNGARVVGRTVYREVISQAYSLIVRSLFSSAIRDFQCGFKAISHSAARELVPFVLDTGWFFDSELLLLAEKNNYRIKEIPVKWTDDLDSRVRIIPTVYGDLKGLLRLRIGGLSTASELLRQGHKPSTH